MRITRMRVLVAAAVAGALAGAAGGALALGSGRADRDGVIHACRQAHGGWLRIPSGKGGCRPRERAVSWSVRGPKGNPGPAGPEGPRGEPGAGLAQLDDLAGIACTTAGGGHGTVELDVAESDTVLLRCLADDAPPPPGTARLVINEVDYDQVGADGDGFVEIMNTGEAPADLAGIALVFVDGADSAEYRREELTGTLAPGAHLVVAVDAQNGAPDGLALLDTAANALVDALSYEGPIAAAQIGEATFDLVEGNALAATVADSNALDGSLIRSPDGRDTDDAASDWAFTTTPTRGAENVLTPLP